MLLSVVGTTPSSPSPLHSTPWNPHFNACNPLLPKSFFPGFEAARTQFLERLLYSTSKNSRGTQPKRPASVPRTINASLIEAPLLWAGRLCVFYALLKAGLAGSEVNPLVSELESDDGAGGESGDMGFSEWLGSLQKKPETIAACLMRAGTKEKEAADRRKLVSKWHPTTKGTLRRNYRVPSKLEGRRLLKAIASLLSEDDHFTDATSHKGCQIRRESAHGESVCCNNVRALFDELPTPHVIVEVTAFPAGPLTENDYAKAEKLERVLRSGPSI